MKFLLWVEMQEQNQTPPKSSNASYEYAAMCTDTYTGVYSRKHWQAGRPIQWSAQSQPLCTFLGSNASTPAVYYLLARAAGCQVSPGVEVPYEDWHGVVVGHIIACVGCSRVVVGPCIACSLRSRVALAPAILYFAALSIVTKHIAVESHFQVPDNHEVPMYPEVCYLSCLLQ